jgi:hypothetical protein
MLKSHDSVKFADIIVHAKIRVDFVLDTVIHSPFGKREFSGHSGKRSAFWGGKAGMPREISKGSPTNLLCLNLKVKPLT